MLCRILRHDPVEYLNNGTPFVQCRRCGLDNTEWKQPLISPRTRATLFTCLGVGLTVYMGLDAKFTNTNDAIAAGILATLAAICAQFGTDKLNNPLSTK